VSFLCGRASRGTVNLESRQVKAPKLYLSDTGQLGALVGADASRVREDDGFAGSLFETFVATELKRLASCSEQPLTFWHHCEAGLEVDVIVEHPSGEIVGLEIKACATVRAGDFAGLRHLGERMGGGAILYAGAHTLPFGKRTWAIPIQALWGESKSCADIPTTVASTAENSSGLSRYEHICFVHTGVLSHHICQNQAPATEIRGLEQETATS
jgi:predicted AAA+ superfamily ATPase